MSRINWGPFKLQYPGLGKQMVLSANRVYHGVPYSIHRSSLSSYTKHHCHHTQKPWTYLNITCFGYTLFQNSQRIPMDFLKNPWVGFWGESQVHRFLPGPHHWWQRWFMPCTNSFRTRNPRNPGIGSFWNSWRKSDKKINKNWCHTRFCQ